MKRLITLSGHDVDDREYAILYINGEFIKSHTHSGCIKKYFDDHDIEYSDFGLYYRSDVETTMNEQDIINEYAFLHYVDGDKCPVDENTGIYIDVNSISGISLGELISKIQSQYPGMSIYNDNNIIVDDIFKIEYEKLAKLSSIQSREYIIPDTPDYYQDYFKKRDPKRLKRLKKLHDNNQYLCFDELIKPTTAGLAMDKVNRMPGDTVTVYHGTSAFFINSILANGLSENVDNSYQSHGANYGVGIWVTLNYDGAKNYAVHSARGWTNDNANSTDEEITQYFNYGAVIEMEVSKDSLNDDGSASNNNLKSNEIITSDKIKQIYVFDINTNEIWNWF